MLSQCIQRKESSRSMWLHYGEARHTKDARVGKPQSFLEKLCVTALLAGKIRR